MALARHAPATSCSAEAEIVLAGYVLLDESRRMAALRRPPTGYYSIAGNPIPVFHVTLHYAPETVPAYRGGHRGRPPSEDYVMGNGPRSGMFLPLIQDHPAGGVAWSNMPAEGAFQTWVIVSMKKEYPGAGPQGHARTVGNWA